MSNNAQGNWTEQRLARLDQLWREGKSANEIAPLLTMQTTPEAGPLSRNAVLGMIHRRRQKQLAAGESEPSLARRATAVPKARRPKAPKAPPRPKPRRSIPRPLVPRPPVVPRPAPIIAESRNLPLLELTDSCCRWPIGEPREPGFVFCAAGKPAEAIVPYCAAHARLAYTPPRVR
jgi:GcrA cell cycle regulator